MTYHEKYNAFYSSQAWKDTRDFVFARDNGLCKECRSKGVVSAGREVHHIEPLDKAWEKRLAIDNLVLLCTRCHNDVHERKSGLKKFKELFKEI